MNPPLHVSDIQEISTTNSFLITPLNGMGTDDATVRVLHVDDDPSFVDVTADFLESIEDDFDVVTETSAQAGLDRLDDEEINCIVSDYEMPETDGLEFLDYVRDTDPEIPFILYTGKGSEEVAGKAITRGVTDYLQKEVGTEQYTVLANRIRNAVDQYQTHRELITTLKWYQRLVEQDLAGIYLVQNDELVYVNAKFADIFGYAQEELIGEDSLTLVDESDEKTVAENIRKREQGEVDSIQYTWTGVTKAGEQVTIDAHGGAIEFQGDPAVLGILLDTTW